MRCAHCPLADPARTCAAAVHPRFCQLAAAGRCLDTIVAMSPSAGAAGDPALDPVAAFAAALPGRDPADPRVRVGVVSPCCYLGGAERWISDLLDRCDGGRLRWVGLATRDPGAGLGLPSLRDDWAAHAPVGHGPAAVRALATAVDVLVAWGVVEANWGIQASWLAGLVPAGLPIVEVSHGAQEYPELRDPAALPGSVAVAVSPAAVRGLVASKRAGARVILNGVDEARVRAGRPRAEVRAGWGVPPGARVVGWLGRLSPEKRPELFVDAVAALPAGWVGVVVGAGLYEGRYRDQVARVAPGRVTFVGTMAAVGDALGAFDVMVMPSETEACSLAAAEAWLAGVPLVSTPVGLLEDHPDLARILPADPTGSEVAAAVLADAADPAGTAARAGRARAFARDAMGMERFGREWTDLVVEVARTRPVVGAHLARCGDDVWVGSRFGCDDQAGRFDRVIHIWRSDYPGDVCRLKDRPGDSGLVVHWREWNPAETLDEMRPGLAEVVAFARVPGRLLVHCAGGVTRGPTLALVAKIARGCDPARAEADIRAAMGRDRGIPVQWVEAIRADVVRRLAPAPAPVPDPVAATRDPAVLARVAACPHRGGELPVSDSAYAGRCCGGAGRTLFGCGLGRGQVPGKVTVVECAACVLGGGLPP